MARTTQDNNLQSPTARARLAIRPEPYYRSLQNGLALGYRRGKRGGTWVARTRDPVSDGYQETKIGPADDQGARTVHALSYDQATETARRIFANLEARRISGVQPDAGKFTIDDILDLYVEGYKDGSARKDKKPGRDLANLLSILQVHVRPVLGAIRITHLNSEMLERLKADLVTKPKLSRSGKPAKAPSAAATSTERSEYRDEAATADDEWDEQAERLRKRRARANRVITPLRAALNHALDKKLFASDAAWRSALKPYPGVDGASVRYLTKEECRRLQAHADNDFRPLVTGALFTGGRYGSLRQLAVKDIDLNARTATFRVTKSGRRQSVKLTRPACEFLKTLIAGKPANAFVFTKTSGAPWKPSDQQRRIADACAKADIDPPITFHELRDTFASHLVMAGVPLLTVSKLLGHADVRVTEKHYAHLAPDHLQKAVDENLPDFSIA